MDTENTLERVLGQLHTNERRRSLRRLAQSLLVDQHTPDDGACGYKATIRKVLRVLRDEGLVDVRLSDTNRYIKYHIRSYDKEALETILTFLNLYEGE